MSATIPLWLPPTLASSRNVPGVRLVAVSDDSKGHAAEKAPVEDGLPSLVLVLLTRLDAKQPSSRWVVVVSVRVGAAEL